MSVISELLMWIKISSPNFSFWSLQTTAYSSTERIMLAVTAWWYTVCIWIARLVSSIRALETNINLYRTRKKRGSWYIRCRTKQWRTFEKCDSESQIHRNRLLHIKTNEFCILTTSTLQHQKDHLETISDVVVSLKQHTIFFERDNQNAFSRQYFYD